MTSIETSAPDLSRIIKRLAPVGPGPRSRVDQALRVKMVALLGSGPVAWAAETVETSVAIGADFSRRDGIPFPEVEVGRNMEVVLLSTLVQLSGGPPPTSWSEAGPQRVRDSAGPDYPAAKMAEGMRLVHRAWSERLLRHAVSSGATMTEMSELTAALANIVDALMEHVLGSETAPSDNDIHQDQRLAEQTIRALLAGQPVADDVVAARLGFRQSDQHLAVVLGRETDASSDATLAASADRLTGQWSSACVTSFEPAPGVIWLWASGPDLPDPLAVRTFDDGTTTPRGIGAVHRGPEGFRRSHLEATDAVRLTNRSRSVVAYEDVELVALLGSDPERARWFVDDALGPLAGSERPMVELRETLLAFYRAEMNLTVAADQLTLHRNTVVQRLQRVDELIGRRQRDELATLMPALLLAEALGEQVLATPSSDATAGETEVRPG